MFTFFDLYISVHVNTWDFKKVQLDYFFFKKRREILKLIFKK